MGRKGGLSMLCWTGRRNECKPCGLIKNHKHALSIRIIIRNSEINSHTLCAKLDIRYIH